MSSLEMGTYSEMENNREITLLKKRVQQLEARLDRKNWYISRKLSLAIAALLVFSSIAYLASDMRAILNSSDGSTDFAILDSNKNEKFHVDSLGNTSIRGGLRLDSAGAECTTSEILIVDGKVGIGTTAPEELLDVDGTAEVTVIRVSGGSSLPTASSALRGTVFHLKGGVGVCDMIYTCAKTSSETYSWVMIGRGN